MKQYILASTLLLGIISSPLSAFWTKNCSLTDNWNKQKKHLKTTMAISLLCGAGTAGHAIIHGNPKDAASYTLCGISAAMLWALLISNQGSQCDFSSIAIAGISPAVLMMTSAVILKNITRYLT